MTFEKEIKEYEDLRGRYQSLVIDRMDGKEYFKYNEVLFSTHSCAIEGNSFSVDDTRELKEKGLGMIPAGKTLFEAFEMLDHFEAFEYMMRNVQHPLDEALLKEINRRVTSHTLAYRAPDATPGEYTTTDMAAGDTVFGDHEELVARVPRLLETTEQAIATAAAHPMVLAARFHGFYEYLHPFREIRILNPQFRHDVIPGDTHPYSLILPSQQIYSYIMSEDSIVNHKANLYAHRDVVEPGDGSDVAEANNSSAGGAVKYHKVQRGEKLSTIANRYGLTVAALKGLNGLKSNRVRTGTVLKVSAPEKVDTADTDNLVADNTDTANADATAASEAPATAATNSPYKGSYSIDSPAPTAAKSEQNKQVGDAFSRSAKHEATAKANDAAQPSKAAETSVKEAEAPNNTPVTNSKQWKARNDRYASKTTTAKASKESTYKNSRSSRTRAKAKPKTVPSSYTIQKGDNLIDIAKKSGVSVDELRKANGISGDKIKAGDKIAIPSKAKAKTYKSRKRRR